jgi:hypothetical protein
MVWHSHCKSLERSHFILVWDHGTGHGPLRLTKKYGVKMKPAIPLKFAGKWIAALVLGAFLVWSPSGEISAKTKARTKTVQLKSATKKTAKVASPKAARVKTAAKAKKVKSQAWVVKLQKKLSAKGFKVQSDGYFGPQTRKALKHFQAKNALRPTGKPDKATLARLYK